MESGVPLGSALAPEMWNYNTGDIPTIIGEHSKTAVYADDTSTASSHRDIETLIDIALKEVWQLPNWTKNKRIKIFSQLKLMFKPIHKNPKIIRK